MQLLRKGYKVLLYLRSVSLYLCLSVAVPAHTVITQLQIILIPQLSRLLCTVLYQLVINLIQLVRIFLEKPAEYLPCLSSDVPVLIYQIGTQQGKIQLLSVKGNLCGSNQLVILCCQIILLLHQRDNFLIHCLLGDFHILKGNRSDFLFQLCPERGMIQLLLISKHHIAVKGHLLVIILLLLLIEGIGGIYIKTDMSNRVQGCHPVIQGIKLLMYGKLLFAVLCLLKFLHQTFHFLFYLFKIYSLVGKFAKLHFFSPFLRPCFAENSIFAASCHPIVQDSLPSVNIPLQSFRLSHTGGVISRTGGKRYQPVLLPRFPIWLQSSAFPVFRNPAAPSRALTFLRPWLHCHSQSQSLPIIFYTILFDISFILKKEHRQMPHTSTSALFFIQNYSPLLLSCAKISFTLIPFLRTLFSH